MSVVDIPEPFSVPEDEEQRTSFRLQNDRMAVWAGRRLHEAQARCAEVNKIAEEEIDRIAAWAREQTRQPSRDADFFAGLLRRYALDVRAEDPKRKSVSTPHVVVSTREARGGWTLDQDVVTAWARDAHPELVHSETKTFVRADELKRLAVATEAGVVDRATGQLVPGVVVAASRVTASVTAVEAAGVGS